MHNTFPRLSFPSLDEGGKSLCVSFFVEAFGAGLDVVSGWETLS